MELSKGLVYFLSIASMLLLALQIVIGKRLAGQGAGWQPPLTVLHVATGFLLLSVPLATGLIARVVMTAKPPELWWWMLFGAHLVSALSFLITTGAMMFKWSGIKSPRRHKQCACIIYMTSPLVFPGGMALVYFAP